MPASLKEQLEAKRAGYDEELTWHRFLLDSYTGAGGYQGRVKQCAAGFWGIAAETYSTFATVLRDQAMNPLGTYLDQFPREDAPKFQRRQNVAHYLNYVKPTTLLKVAYICRKPIDRNNIPDEVKEWIDRTGYDKDFRRRAIVTAVLGWFPMVVDMASAPSEAITVEQTGKLDPYVVLNLPCHLLDYQLDDDGRFLWAKMGMVFDRKADWRGECVKVARYTLWSPTEFAVYEAVGDGAPVLKAEGKHPFKQVPIVSWRADVSVEDAIKAESVNASIALEARRLFNLVSERDEHIRSQVFALLVWPGTAPAANDKGQAGVSDGLIFDGNSKHVPQFLAPPASVADTLLACIAAAVVEIYRIAGVEYEKASGANSSAASKAQEFAKTNVGIAALAGALATAELQTLTLVGRGLGVSEDKLAKMEVTAHDDYAEEALGDEMEVVLQAITLAIGVTAKAELLKRTVSKLLPGLGADTAATIEDEIDAAAVQAEKDAAAMQKAQEDALKEPAGSGEPGDDESASGDAGEDDAVAAEE